MDQAATGIAAEATEATEEAEAVAMAMMYEGVHEEIATTSTAMMTTTIAVAEMIAARTETRDSLAAVILPREIHVATMTVTAPTTEIPTIDTLKKRAVAAAWASSSASCRATFVLPTLILRPDFTDCRKKRTVRALTGRRDWCWG